MFTFLYKRATGLYYGEAQQLLDHASDISNPFAFARTSPVKQDQFRNLKFSLA